MSHWLDNTMDYVDFFTRWDTAPQAHRDAFEAWINEPVKFRLDGYYSFVVWDRVVE